MFNRFLNIENLLPCEVVDVDTVCSPLHRENRCRGHLFLLKAAVEKIPDIKTINQSVQTP